LAGIPSPFIPCPASWSRNGSFKTNKATVRESIKSMFTNQEQTAAASIASRKSTRQETTSPSDADIATKAYKIWLSRGQEAGNDQQHWFEARQQLQLA